VQSADGRIGIAVFAFIMAQLSLLFVVLRQFQIESNALLRLAILAFAGFAIHSFLPMRYRLPFFAILSLGGITLVFGVVQAAWLIALGVLLIGVCHLPLMFGARVAILIALALILVSQRSGWLPAPWSQAVWPILGSMFMFRLVLYLYDLRHEQPVFSPSRVASYFFLLPNVCFPLFPVVDFKTFRRNYYDADAYSIYQTGIGWMARGALHLILYRVVYYYLTLSPTEVKGPGDLVQFVVANFLLYLRVSGQFHFIVGLLYLFGFRLPETHHLYYLASSFTDFWRRINIYWKDFMQKVFYYPAFFQLKGLGISQALIISTVFVFIMTWLLHAYQWFWLRGSFLLTIPDASFWAILAVLVVANSLWEIRFGRTRRLRKEAPTARTATWLAFRTVATFAVIAILWSLWTAESLSAWWGLMSAAREPIALPSHLAPTLLVAVLAVATSPTELRDRHWRWAELRQNHRSTAITVASLLAMALLGLPAVYTRLGTVPANFILSLRTGQLNRVDHAMMERGYYEDLVRVDRFNSQLWQLYMNRPAARWIDVQASGLGRFTGDFLHEELRPGFRAMTRYGSITTNRWGMRDRDYGRRPSSGTYRIALLGASTVMGWGVGDDETFEALLETRLNEAHPGRHDRYEILNLAVPGYQPPQQRVALDKALQFEPHAVYYVATGREASRSIDYLAEVVRKRVVIPYPFLVDIARKAGIDATTESTTAIRRLRPFRTEVLAWLYGEIVASCRKRGVVPVLVFLPQLQGGDWEVETPEILRTAQNAGFILLDISDVYRGHDPTTLRLAEWDEHPNAAGHRVIAERLHNAVRTRAGELFADAGAPAAAR
jgi:D-alanyl-lipoteichoic acid acyltransferase DltB (MBOAT superfamily)